MSRTLDLRNDCRRVLLSFILLLAPAIAFGIQPPERPLGTESAQSTIEWSWDAVEGAVSYELTIDGEYAANIEGTSYTSFDLWPGDHSLTVKSIDGDGRYSDQSLTAKMVLRAIFNPAVANTTYLVGIEEPPASTGGGLALQNDKPADAPAETTAAAPANDAAPPAPEPVAPVADRANTGSDTSDEESLIDSASYDIAEATSKPGYDLVFSDEFNSPSLNPYRWNTQLRWDGEFNGERYEYRVVNGEDQFYVNIFSDDSSHRDSVASEYDPFQLDGSRLAIRAVRNPLKRYDANRSYGPLDEMVSQQTFLSGALTTYDKFYQKFGYFEARIKIPNHVGTFPAFWLYHQNRRWEGTQRTEIDVMENLGHAPWYIYNSFHYFTDVSSSYGGDANFLKPQPEGQIYTGTDYSAGYHVYAVEWEPGVVRWLIDGEVVSELRDDNVNYEELYIILNLAMGGNWTNYPANAGGLGRDSNDFFPTDDDLADGNFNNPALEIDYVRVYKRR